MDKDYITWFRTKWSSWSCHFEIISEIQLLYLFRQPRLFPPNTWSKWSNYQEFIVVRYIRHKFIRKVMQYPNAQINQFTNKTKYITDCAKFVCKFVRTLSPPSQHHITYGPRSFIHMNMHIRYEKFVKMSVWRIDLFMHCTLNDNK